MKEMHIFSFQQNRVGVSPSLLDQVNTVNFNSTEEIVSYQAVDGDPTLPCPTLGVGWGLELANHHS